jgi:hypothetical protein
MKKIIPLIFALLCLTGCKAKNYTPVINTAFDVNAKYKTGDFSYSCEIVKNETSLSVTATSTKASGTTITFDGQNLTFVQGDLSKTISADNVEKTNPSIVLYEVFTSLESDNCNVEKNGEQFKYTGKTSVGDYVLLQNSDNSYSNLYIQNADITVEFVN